MDLIRDGRKHFAAVWAFSQLATDLTRESDADDIDTLLDLCDNIAGRSFCALADGTSACVTSAVKHFRSEFEAGSTTPAWEAFAYERSALDAVAV